MVLVLAFVIFIIWDAFRLTEVDKTNAAVEAIHAQKLTLAVVNGDTQIKLGVDQATYDATVEGVDSNNDGIRDDVELAIFKKYINDKKARAAALQYAMTEQMFLTRVYNTETWKAVAEESSRANHCTIQTNLSSKDVKTIVLETFNTNLRKEAQDKAFEFTTGVGTAPGEPCDVSF